MQWWSQGRSAGLAACAALVIGGAVSPARPAPIDDVPNPQPRTLVVGDLVRRWDFATDTDGWQARRDCRLAVDAGALVIESDGVDPHLSTPVAGGPGGAVVRVRLRTTQGGPVQFFWTSDRQPGESPARQATVAVAGDGRWHEHEVPLPVEGRLTGLRLDPVGGTGRTEVDHLAIHAGGWHPLEIAALEAAGPARARVYVRNHAGAVAATLDGRPVTLPAGLTSIEVDAAATAALEFRTLRLEAPGLPPVERGFWAYDPAIAGDVIARRLGDLDLRIARDGSAVRIDRGGQPVAALAPLVHRAGRLPALTAVDAAAWPLVFTGDGLRVTLGADDGAEVLTTRIEPDAGAAPADPARSVEGPVVRAFGRLEQGLLAGVEYLGREERSSSRLDIETDEHLRFEPDPLDLTMPLMALVTDRAAVALVWDDTTLQPTFAAPDFVDLAPGHRMSLRGPGMAAAIRVGPGWTAGGRLEPIILWAVRRRGGLPPRPVPPRSPAEQEQLARAAFAGPMHDPDTGGWLHAVVPGVRRMPDRGGPLADCVSAIFRLTGTVPPLDRLQPGGGHLPDHTSWFVAGRAAEWRRHVDAQAAELRRTQAADGSWRYDGPYARGHFETTASGVCAKPCATLLEHARLTGDDASLAAGLRGLEFLSRFRTPRGAQVWEVPLHTPDLLASAYATWAHVLAHELTGAPGHLAEARRWALTGVPFVYQWSDRPEPAIMAYATIAVYGATNWQAPNWIGLPVQWCGTVYAHALLRLAPHDDTLDWRGLAEGITVCAERMIYPDGGSVGCLPDVFDLRGQRRLPADIQPGLVVSLRRQLDGLPDGLSVAVAAGHRVIAPFPVTIAGGTARVKAPAGLRFQVLADGRVIDVEGRGDTEVVLAPPAPVTDTR